MSSAKDTNNKSGKKERPKRSMLTQNIAENVEADSDLSLDGTPRPEFHDDVSEEVELIIESDEIEQETNTLKPGIDGETMYGVFKDSTEEEETQRKKDTLSKNKPKPKRKSSFHDSDSDEETAKRVKGKCANSNDNDTSSKQQKDHRGQPRRSFHDSQEEDN